MTTTAAVLARLLALALLAVLPASGAADVQPGPHVAVLGAGYSGLAAACELRRLGYDVTVYEQNAQTGGRAHRFSAGGFVFDAGPSWYWMPEVFEAFFARFGRQVSEFYSLQRLDPAYRVVNDDGHVDVPGTEEGFMQFAHALDPEAGQGLEVLMLEGKEKYEKGIFEWIWKPMLSATELVDFELGMAGLRLDMFGGLVEHLKRFVSSPVLLDLLKWPVIFIGASPEDAPALYSLMTYAGHALGTWYPSGGMASPALAMAKLAEELGVQIRLEHEVTRFEVAGRAVTQVCGSSPGGEESCDAVDAVVSAADYHHVEQVLLPPELRRYGPGYWERQVLSPSCLLFYLGFDTKLPGLLHHTFFFDEDLDAHLNDAFRNHRHSEKFTFYVSATSKTDPDAAPEGSEALFVLVPVSYKLNGTDVPQLRNHVLELVLNRLERRLGVPVRQYLTYSQDYGPADFETEFHSFRGNAFGHANLLSQSLLFKPSMDSLASNMVFAGHLTNPGPGVPPSIVSGTVAAQLLDSKLKGELGQAALQGSWGGLLGRLLVGVVVLHFVALACVLASKRGRSYLLCVKLLFEHGRTYFAAATLMNRQRFLDTAALYGLFRVADDLVDNEDSGMERHENLERFIADFWGCWERGIGDYDLHPTMPAIIETSMRHGYSKDLFERFFRSMRMDVGAKVCHTLDDTMDYMEGSAAVIGEFMLPVLLPHASPEAHARAMPHARDLGLAFQLTNMIRDVDEDLDLQRQYVPVQICEQHGVDLRQRDSRQPGFKGMMEAMFDHADGFYVSADLGIAMLPEDVRDVIKVARIAYHRIHFKIRAREYDIFSGPRARVPFREKLEILASTVPAAKLLRILAVELYVRALHMLVQPPMLLLQLGLVLTTLLASPGCTYLGFHLRFIVPALLLLAALARTMVLDRTRQQREHLGSCVRWAAVLCVVATVYTTPWDNYLVATSVWGYPLDRVLFRVGYVPVEEYLFFSLETAMVCLLWLCCQSNAAELHLAAHRASPNGAAVARGGLAALCAIFLSGVWMLAAGVAQLHYLGLILVWALPVLIFQWCVGAQVLLVHARPAARTVIGATAFLSVVDGWAIRNGIWAISADATLPQIFFVPIEEATFFLVTSTMCVWGLTLAMVADKHKRSRNTTWPEAIQYLALWPRSDDTASPRSRDAARRTRRAKDEIAFSPEETAVRWCNALAAILVLVCSSSGAIAQLGSSVMVNAALATVGVLAFERRPVVLAVCAVAIVAHSLGELLPGAGLITTCVLMALSISDTLETQVGFPGARLHGFARRGALCCVSVALQPKLLLAFTETVGIPASGAFALLRTARLVGWLWFAALATLLAVCKSGRARAVCTVALNAGLFSVLAYPAAFAAHLLIFHAGQRLIARALGQPGSYARLMRQGSQMGVSNKPPKWLS